MTLTSKKVNQFFRVTHRLMIIHHYTKFGKKWFRGLGDTERTWSDTQTELQTDGQSDCNITPQPPPHSLLYQNAGVQG